jgi:hypothetical protein
MRKNEKWTRKLPTKHDEGKLFLIRTPCKYFRSFRYRKDSGIKKKYAYETGMIIRKLCGEEYRYYLVTEHFDIPLEDLSYNIPPKHNEYLDISHLSQ